jgi:CheY-like chemotaxis protein
MRAAGCNRHIVAFTASGFETARDEALAAGAEDVWWKPYKQDELLESIRVLLDVRYIYRAAPSDPGVRGEAVLASDLGRSLRAAPAELRAELKECAVRARAVQLEALTSQLAQHAPEAAERVRVLLHDFEYETLVQAIDIAANA